MTYKFSKPTLTTIVALSLFWQQPALAQDEDVSEPEVDNVFVEFQPISVAIIRDYRIQGQLAVTLFLSVNKASSVERIEELRPKLTDKLIQSLTRIANTRVSPNKPVDLQLIGRFLQTNVDEVLGEDVAKVLIQSAAAQPY